MPRSPPALALAVAPAGFTVAEFTTKVRAMTGQTPEDYSTRQGAYDLRKLRGKQLVIKPGRTRRYHVPEVAARTITALLTIRDKVIAPLIAGIRTPRRGRPPKHWTKIDRDYETLRREMQTLLNHLGIATKATAAIDNELSIAPRNPLVSGRGGNGALGARSAGTRATHARVAITARRTGSGFWRWSALLALWDVISNVRGRPRQARSAASRARAILCPVAAAPTLHRLSPELYDRLVDTGLLEGEPVELVDGLLVHVTPQGAEHAALVRRLTRHLSARSDLLNVQLPLAVPDGRPEPDLALALDPGLHEHPHTADLVVEIAVTSWDDDVAKLPGYAAAGVGTAWLVNVAARAVHVFRAAVRTPLRARTGPACR